MKPKIVGGGTEIPRTPIVSDSQWVTAYSTTTPNDIVAIARYRPFRRRQGNPRRMPKNAATTPPLGIVIQKGMPNLVARIAEV